MATDAITETKCEIPEPVVEREAAHGNYDRSSLTGDYMVMIADQTPDDFEKYAPEKQYCDYIDGVVYMPSPATDRHMEHVGFFFFLLHGFHCERGGLMVLMGPAVLRLAENWKPEPDIFVRPGVESAQPHAPALLVIEVLSRSTRTHDLVRKLAVYQEAGVQEIWFLDDRDHELIVERREGDGYRRERLVEGRLHCASIPGFWIDVAWLWESPLPNARRCLDQILAEPPA